MTASEYFERAEADLAEHIAERKREPEIPIEALIRASRRQKGPKRKIVGFAVDGHWIAHLECGHSLDAVVSWDPSMKQLMPAEKKGDLIECYLCEEDE